MSSGGSRRRKNSTKSPPREPSSFKSGDGGEAPPTLPSFRNAERKVRSFLGTTIPKKRRTSEKKRTAMQNIMFSQDLQKDITSAETNVEQGLQSFLNPLRERRSPSPEREGDRTSRMKMSPRKSFLIGQDTYFKEGIGRDSHMQRKKMRQTLRETDSQGAVSAVDSHLEDDMLEEFAPSRRVFQRPVAVYH